MSEAKRIATVPGVALYDAPPSTDPVATAAARELGRQRFMRNLIHEMGGLPEIAGADRASHWAELLTPQLTDAFFIGYFDDGRRASLIPSIFGGFTSDRAFEEFIGVGALGSEQWNFEATGRVQRDEVAKGFSKRFTHVEFAKGIWAQRKLIEDNMTQIVFDRGERLGDSAYKKREKGAASVFNNAFTDTGTNVDGLPIAGPDGVGLCSTAHPRSAEDTGTQSNEGTAALDESGLEVTRQAHMAMEDDRGDIMDVMPDELLVPPELEDKALKLTRSAQEPGTANNAINPQNGRFSTRVWHYLTAPKAWFMMDSSRRRRALRWYDRVGLEFGPDENDRTTFQVGYDAYMRYSYGWVDWSFIFGQNPA